jgi:hypothetical protein
MPWIQRLRDAFVDPPASVAEVATGQNTMRIVDGTSLKTKQGGETPPCLPMLSAGNYRL